MESTSNADQHPRQITSSRSGGSNTPNTTSTGCGHADAGRYNPLPLTSAMLFVIHNIIHAAIE